MYLKLIKILWSLFITGWTVVILCICAIVYNWDNIAGPMPNTKVLENPKSELASELYSADTVLLGKYYRENRSNIHFEDLSKELVNALIASEDIRFYEHSGIDFKGTFAIPYYLVRHYLYGSQKRGSSTITQQLAKNLFGTRNNPKYQGKVQGNYWLETITFKIKEWIMSIKLEKAYTKKEILTMYLNTVDFGSLAFGIKVASKTYFNTSPEEITTQEAAVLVGMLQAPSYYNPIRHPERAKEVRDKVMSQMTKYGYIEPLEFDSLKELPVIDKAKFEVESHNTGLATYFRAEVKKELVKFCEESGYDLFADGLKVYTTINSRMQQYAEESVEEHMRFQQAQFFDHWKGRNPWIDEDGKEMPNFLENAVRKTEAFDNYRAQYPNDTTALVKALKERKPMEVFSWERKRWKKRKDGSTVQYTIDTVLSTVDSVKYYKHFLHAGMMTMDPYNGHIKAWVGGINFKYFKYDHVKQGYRQPGSTFKPILYTAAIAEEHMDPCFKVLDSPITFIVTEADENGKPVDKSWTPKNSGPYSNQEYTLRQAMAKSINTVAAYLVRELTPARVVRYAEEKFGFRYLREKYNISAQLEPVPAICLGTSDVSVFELVPAYGTFINKGVWTEPVFITRIEDKNGKILWTAVPKTIEALSEEDAYVMTYMLRGTTEEDGGTARGLYRYSFTEPESEDIKFEIGGKTGTTSNYSDAWFIGLTHQLISGIWVGGDDRSIHFRDLAYGQGARQAMPAYGIFMDKVMKDASLGYTKRPFPLPKVPITVEIDCSKYTQTSTDSLNVNHPAKKEEGIY